jgi:hypothetical protein
MTPGRSGVQGRPILREKPSQHAQDDHRSSYALPEWGFDQRALFRHRDDPGWMHRNPMLGISGSKRDLPIGSPTKCCKRSDWIPFAGGRPSKSPASGVRRSATSLCRSPQTVITPARP